MINGHGGNIYALSESLGCKPADIIDMSSNVNPLGPIPEMMEHLRSSLSQITLLPEADAGRIVRLFAEYHGVDHRQVVAANGTTQFIYQLPIAMNFKKVLILTPTYSDYNDACKTAQCKITNITAGFENNFYHDLNLLDDMAPHFDAAYICNPNNPTGVLIPPEKLYEIAKKHKNTIFIIDESYLPFVSEGENLSLIQIKLPNIIVLNSMSKIFRIPGIRIGFLIAQKSIIDRLLSFMMPWSVNTIAQQAVTFLMGTPDITKAFINKTRHYMEKERVSFLNKFKNTNEIKWIESKTSFLLGKLCKNFNSGTIHKALAAEKILIRNCSNFNGLTDQYIRISLKTRDINEMVGDLLLETISNGMST